MANQLRMEERIRAEEDRLRREQEKIRHEHLEDQRALMEEIHRLKTLLEAQYTIQKEQDYLRRLEELDARVQQHRYQQAEQEQMALHLHSLRSMPPPQQQQEQHLEFQQAPVQRRYTFEEMYQAVSQNMPSDGVNVNRLKSDQRKESQLRGQLLSPDQTISAHPRNQHVLDDGQPLSPQIQIFHVPEDHVEPVLSPPVVSSQTTAVAVDGYRTPDPKARLMPLEGSQSSPMSPSVTPPCE